MRSPQRTTCSSPTAGRPRCCGASRRDPRSASRSRLTHTYPATDSEGDRAAAWWADGSFNRWYLDPLYGRGYPADMVEHFAPEGPPVQDGDLEAIAAPTDFLGANHYFRQVVSEDPNGDRPILVRDPDWSFTAMGWEVYPDGLRDLLTRLRDDYAPPGIYIFENGAAYDDLRGHDGEVVDPERQAYLDEHLAAVGHAIEDGVPVRGYFAWSLLDNFEWAEGYSKRFGLVYVDYPTLERVPKGSFYWYRDFIAAQRVSGGQMARIGLMLYTVRQDCARDFEGTLRAVASLGYEGVELFDLHGHDATVGAGLARRARPRRVRPSRGARRGRDGARRARRGVHGSRVRPSRAWGGSRPPRRPTRRNRWPNGWPLWRAVPPSSGSSSVSTTMTARSYRSKGAAAS